ncbi:MAG: hypothetical protein ACR2L6_07410 [Gemmatimonadaceae bacterium]
MRRQCLLALSIAGLTTSCFSEPTSPSRSAAPQSDVPRNAIALVEVSTVAALRAAIRDAEPNQRIFIAPGMYDLGNQGLRVESKRDLEIFGSGRGRTMLLLGPDFLTGIDTPGNIQGLSIAHMTIRGTLPSNVQTTAIGTGDDRVSMTGVRFFDLEIANVAVGISTVSPRGGQCSDISITGNYLDNIQDFVLPGGFTRGSGYGIHNENCWRVRIADNVIRNADRHSIYQALQSGYGGTGVVIENNLIIDHATTPSIDRDYLIALSVARSQNVVVAHNVIVAPAHDALGLEGYEPGAEGLRGPVRDIYFIGNTVLGAKGSDVYLTQPWSWVFWGNRFAHRDAGTTNVARVSRVDAGLHTVLTDPAAFPQTQRVAAATPFTATYIMQAGKLHSLWSGYSSFASTSPGLWARSTMPESWPGFQDMTAGKGRIYVLADNRVTEVVPGSWSRRTAPFTLTSVTGMGFAGSSLYVVSDGRIHRIDPTSWSDQIVGPALSGRINGVAQHANVLYVMMDNAVTSIDLSSL